MHFSLPLANALPLEFQIQDGVRIVDCSQPKAVGPSDWTAQFVASLEHPLGFPPLAASILPGDQVVIAVEPDLPQAAVAIRLLLGSLVDSGLEPADIRVAVAMEQLEALRKECLEECPAAWTEAIAWRGHDPSDDNEHAFLAITKDGRPIYLHRPLCEADVMIPLGVCRGADLLNDLGVHGSWFPKFSNVAAKQRFYAAGNLQWETHHRRRREEIEEAAWLLGVHFVAQLVPGPAGTVFGVCCGEAKEVARKSYAAMASAWEWEIEAEVDAAVAVIDGPENQQSWSNVAQALQVASRVVREGGTIILWTNLSTPPGPALTSLARGELSAEDQQLTLLKLHTADATAAKIIGDCLDTHRIFMHSQLHDAHSEDIGIGALHSAIELERLLHEPKSCLVIGSAQHAAVRLRK